MRHLDLFRRIVVRGVISLSLVSKPCLYFSFRIDMQDARELSFGPPQKVVEKCGECKLELSSMMQAWRSSNICFVRR
jgi:hypothetical protein